MSRPNWQRNDPRSQQPSRTLSDPDRQQLEKAIKNGDALATITYASELGQRLAANGLTTAQIRNIFGEVRQIQALWGDKDTDKSASEKAYRRAVLLIPKLGYQAKRAAPRTRTAMEELEIVFSEALMWVAKAGENDRRDYFMHFVDFFEAVLAYHKKYGGRES